MLKKTLRSIIFATSLLFIMSLFTTAQTPPPPSKFELPCSANTSPLPPNGWTQDPATNLYRAWICVDPNGFISSPVFATSGPATSVPFSGVTAATNTNPLNEGTGGSITPTGTGQVASHQVWMPAMLVSPSLSALNTGGSIAINHTVRVVITENTALGESYPGPEVNIGTGGSCTGGNQCSVPISPITLSSGFISWNAYVSDNGASGSELKLAACSNIASGVGCTITTGGAGSTPPTSNTAFIQPPGTSPTQGLAGSIPSLFIQDSSGNYQPAATVDNTSSAVLTSPFGKLTFVRPMYFNDTGNPLLQARSGGFIIAHMSGVGVINAANVDDRALMAVIHNSATATPTYEQYLGQYNEVDIENANTRCAPVGGETCAAAGRFVASDTRTSASNGMDGQDITGAVGVSGQDADTGSNANQYIGVDGHAQVTVSGNLHGRTYIGVRSYLDNISGSGNGTGFGFQCKLIDAFPSENDCFYAGANNGWTSFIRSDILAPSYFAGIINAAGGGQIGNATYNFTGSQAITGSFSTTSITIPTFNNGNVGQSGVAGTTSYTYKITAVDGNGIETAGSAAGTTAIGNATLSASNFNQILFTCVRGPSSYNLYRTASGGTPSSTGKIATGLQCSNIPFGGTSIIVQDKALAGDSTTPPTTNNTGGIQYGGPLTQAASNTIGGTCSMSTSTTCTITLAKSYTTPVCIVTEQSALATVLAGACSVSGVTVTITSISVNSATWGALVFGNPN